MEQIRKNFDGIVDRVEAKRDPPDWDLLNRELRKLGLSLLDVAKAAGKDLERKRARKGRYFTPITIADIKQFPDPKFLIDNILIEGTITLLGSYAGKGKTLLALSLMRSILDGFPWLGRYNINRTGPVLLINEESPDSVLKTYTARIPVDASFHVLHFAEVRIDRKPDQAELERVIDVLNPILIVIDSLVRIHGHQEDSSVEMAQVMGCLRRFSNNGATILLLHHHNKGNGALETRARGSSDIPAGVDLELALYEKKEQLILQSVKSRFKPFEPIILEITEEDGVPGFRLAKSVRDAAREALIDLLNGEAVDFKTIREQLDINGVDIGEHKLRCLLKNLDGKELITTRGDHGKRLYSRLSVL